MVWVQLGFGKNCGELLVLLELLFMIFISRGGCSTFDFWQDAMLLPCNYHIAGNEMIIVCEQLYTKL